MLIDLKKLIEKYKLNIRGIIHGGAHHAEESDLYTNLKVDNVIWIEANPKKADFCKEKLFNKPGNLVIAHAISDIDDQRVELNITNNGESSSILNLKNHKNFYPQINVVEKINVLTKRLDTIIDEYKVDIKNYNFLNLDLQGIELRALKGLGKYLSDIDYVYSEINKSELYDGCDQIQELDSYLLSFGFVRVETQWTHADWGDALYIKAPKLKIIVTSYNNENWVQTNIESLLEQTYSNYEVLFVDDNSSDETYEIAHYLTSNDSRFKLIKHNENKSKCFTFMHYVKDFAMPDDIIVFVDGDDWLPYNSVLADVATYYLQNDIWVGYTKMICYPSLEKSPVHGKDHPDYIHKYNLYRQYPFIASHLKTMKGFLFHNINESNFIYNGNWIRFGDDVAIMCAAMEQSPANKIGVMDFVGYVYNESQSSKERTSKDQQQGSSGENYIRSIKPYSVIKDNSDKFVSPRMLGRLGNQMFEIAAAYSFALDNKCSVKVCLQNGVFTSQLGEIGSPLDYKETVFKNIEFVDTIQNYDTWQEQSFSYTPISYKFDNNLYLDGQFQSEKYFVHNSSKIRKLFECNSDIKNYIVNKYGSLFSKTTVSLHVRRGDYLVTPNHHPLCSIDYYSKALTYFNNNEQILIFTDDPKWAKNVFLDDKFVVIEGEKDYIDLYMMSMCNHNIIANSSFSWWGAWLNPNTDKKVIAPSNWFGPSLNQHNTADLLPNSWLKI